MFSRQDSKSINKHNFITKVYENLKFHCTLSCNSKFFYSSKNWFNPILLCGIWVMEYFRMPWNRLKLSGLPTFGCPWLIGVKMPIGINFHKFLLMWGCGFPLKKKRVCFPMAWECGCFSWMTKILSIEFFLLDKHVNVFLKEKFCVFLCNLFSNVFDFTL